MFALDHAQDYYLYISVTCRRERKLIRWEEELTLGHTVQEALLDNAVTDWYQAWAAWQAATATGAAQEASKDEEVAWPALHLDTQAVGPLKPNPSGKE